MFGPMGADDDGRDPAEEFEPDLFGDRHAEDEFISDDECQCDLCQQHSETIDEDDY